MSKRADGALRKVIDYLLFGKRVRRLRKTCIHRRGAKDAEVRVSFFLSVERTERKKQPYAARTVLCWKPALQRVSYGTIF